MKVKTKIIDVNINTPKLTYSKEGDAGIDLTATSKWYDDNGNVCFGTNRAFEIPKGFVGLLFPRSSNANKDLILSNSVGILDSGYRGEVMLKFKYGEHSERLANNILAGIQKSFKAKGDYKYQKFNDYQIGDRIGQIIILPYPKIEFEEVENLSDSDRGVGGYGSTGN